jgi:hypothetical protein
VDKSLDQRRFTEALSALDDMMSSVNLRRPLMPIKLHANLMTLALKVRRVAAEEEQDRSRREAMADAALKWTDRVLGVLPSNPEACISTIISLGWFACNASMPVRPTSRCARCPMHRPRRAALNLAQSELDRFLLPVNPSWHGNGSAAVRTLRVRIPG